MVHTHGERPDVLDAGVARRLGIPTVTTLHGSSKLGGLSRVHEWLQMLVLRRFDAVVAVSRPLAQSLPTHGVSCRRVHMLPNCWNGKVPTRGKQDARQFLGLDTAAFVVGWVGRLIPAKGADVFLDALAQLRDLPCVASIVGDGPQRRVLEDRSKRLGLQGRIVFHGEVRDASQLFGAFDVFVLSSRTEGTPNVLLEAMAARVPIVASGVGGVPDVISDSEGVVVAPENPFALAAAIRTVYEQPSRARDLASAAERRLHTEFSLESWLSRYEAIYRAVQAGGADRRG